MRIINGIRLFGNVILLCFAFCDLIVRMHLNNIALIMKDVLKIIVLTGA